jgi:glycine/D-amino acid oxidase-like deaminating enzyme
MAETEALSISASEGRCAYDVVVVGGGVVGLMTAVRLANTGASVALLETGLLGSGSTTRNHGMIHSGALYARWHPEVVTACSRAQTAYRMSFPTCVAGNQACWYLGSFETIDAYQDLWRGHRIKHRWVDSDEWREVLTAPETAAACAVPELLIDTRAMVLDLAAQCLARGVHIVVDATVLRVIASDGMVSGVETVAGVVDTDRVIVCAGIGTRGLLERSGSVVAAELSSRLETMVALPGVLPCAITGLEPGWPALAPAVGGDAVFASRIAVSQRTVHEPARWPVPLRDTSEIVDTLTAWLRPGFVEPEAAVGWVCSKTEHVANAADEWGTRPDYAVIDHCDRDGVRGWWTVLPGKMTLALHASRSVAFAATGRHSRLALAPHDGAAAEDANALVDVSPWTAHQKAGTR